MTRDELVRRTLLDLDESPSAPAYWQVAEIRDYLDDAQEVVAERAPYVKRTTVIPRRTGVTVYRLSGINGQIMVPSRIWLPDLKRRLQAVTLLELDGRHQHWWTTTGEPWWWCGLSWDTFLSWPPPTTGEGWLQVESYSWPVPLEADTDEPELHASVQPELVNYATFLGKLKQWDANGAAEALQRFLGQTGHVSAQANVNQAQSRLWSRQQARSEANDGDGWR